MATSPTPTTASAPANTQDLPESLGSLANSLITAYYPSASITNVADLSWPATVVIDGTSLVVGGTMSPSLVTSSGVQNVQSTNPPITIPTKPTPTPSASHKGQAGDRKLGIILGVVLGVVTLLVLLAAIWFVLRRKRSKRGLAEKRASGLDSEAASLRHPEMSQDTSYPPLPPWIGTQNRDRDRDRDRRDRYSMSSEKRAVFTLPETIHEAPEENPFMSPQERAEAERGYAGRRSIGQRSLRHKGGFMSIPTAGASVVAAPVLLPPPRALGYERQHSRSTLGDTASYYTPDENLSMEGDHRHEEEMPLRMTAPAVVAPPPVPTNSALVHNCTPWVVSPTKTPDMEHTFAATPSRPSPPMSATAAPYLEHNFAATPSRPSPPMPATVAPHPEHTFAATPLRPSPPMPATIAPQPVPAYNRTPPEPLIPSYIQAYYQKPATPENPFISREDPPEHVYRQQPQQQQYYQQTPYEQDYRNDQHYEHQYEHQADTTPILPQRNGQHTNSPMVHYPTWAEISEFDFANNDARSSVRDSRGEYDLGDGYYQYQHHEQPAERELSHYERLLQQRGLYEGT